MAQFVPTIGTYLAIVLPVIVGLQSDKPVIGIVALGWGILYQQVENLTLEPRISAKATDVHPPSPSSGVLLGTALFGVAGALLAVPVVAVLLSLVAAFGERHQLVAELGGDPRAPTRPSTPPRWQPVASRPQRRRRRDRPGTAHRRRPPAVPYGLATVDLHRILVQLRPRPGSPEYKAPLNAIHTAAASPTRRTVGRQPQRRHARTPTPGSTCATGPVLLTMPAHDPGRYMSAQVVDLYSYIVGYLSPRTTGCDGGTYLIQGPSAGAPTLRVDGVLECPTDLCSRARAHPALR